MPRRRSDKTAGVPSKLAGRYQMRIGSLSPALLAHADADTRVAIFEMAVDKGYGSIAEFAMDLLVDHIYEEGKK